MADDATEILRARTAVFDTASAGTGRHASPDAGEDDFKTSTRQMPREMHIPDARHQANQQDPWGALRLRRQECSHREIKANLHAIYIRRLCEQRAILTGFFLAACRCANLDFE